MSYGTWLGTHLSALVTVAGGMFAENLLQAPRRYIAPKSSAGENYKRVALLLISSERNKLSPRSFLTIGLLLNRNEAKDMR